MRHNRVNLGNGCRGIYVTPEAVTTTPEYAKRLFEEAGVEIFQLRTGFDPGAPAPELQEAVEIVRNLGARVYLLVGTWWGHGIEPAGDAMTRPEQFDAAEPDRYGPAHERQWDMRTPGGPADDEIESALAGFCRVLEPDGVCLTHARYRHPAHIHGLFEYGPATFMEMAEELGLGPAALTGAWARAMERLRIDGIRDPKGSIPSFLDSLADTDLFSRWFQFRSEIIFKSILRFRKAALEAGPKDMVFGQNAYGPEAAEVCGQPFEQMPEICDFLQPLLGYVEWHVLQPLAAWASLLIREGVDPARAMRYSAGLFGLSDVDLPDTPTEAVCIGEGPDRLITACVRSQLRMIAAESGEGMEYCLVLRGDGWPAEVVGELEEEARRAGAGRVFFQGTRLLAGEPPDAGWA